MVEKHWFRGRKEEGEKQRFTEAALAVFLALIVFGFIAIVLKICSKINECFLRDVDGGQLNK